MWITYPPVNFLKSVTFCNFLLNEMFRLSKLRELCVSRCTGLVQGESAVKKLQKGSYLPFYLKF